MQTSLHARRRLPVQVLVVDGDGKALSVTKGLVTAGELQQSLTRAVASFSSQVPVLLTGAFLLVCIVKKQEPRQVSASEQLQVAQSKTAEQPGPVSDDTEGTAGLWLCTAA